MIEMSQQVIWPQQNLARALANAAQRWSTHEALVISGRRMTYPALWQSVQQVGAALKACGRAARRSRCCLHGNSIEWVVFFYAAATVGRSHGTGQHALQGGRVRVLPETGGRKNSFSSPTVF
jgi:acyl-CoA synthetase (AMP-forming)/AMP-acid ligase II